MVTISTRANPHTRNKQVENLINGLNFRTLGVNGHANDSSRFIQRDHNKIVAREILDGSQLTQGLPSRDNPSEDPPAYSSPAQRAVAKVAGDAFWQNLFGNVNFWGKDIPEVTDLDIKAAVQAGIASGTKAAREGLRRLHNMETHEADKETVVPALDSVIRETYKNTPIRLVYDDDDGLDFLSPKSPN